MNQNSGPGKTEGAPLAPAPVAPLVELETTVLQQIGGWLLVVFGGASWVTAVVLAFSGGGDAPIVTSFVIGTSLIVLGVLFEKLEGPVKIGPAGLELAIRKEARRRARELHLPEDTVDEVEESAASIFKSTVKIDPPIPTPRQRSRIFHSPTADAHPFKKDKHLFIYPDKTAQTTIDWFVESAFRDVMPGVIPPSARPWDGS